MIGRDEKAFGDLRVVVLDDNRNFQILMRTMLRHLGFRHVETFSEPAEAMSHVSEHPIDIVFVDYVMPGLDGARWTRTVRHLVDLANPEMAIVLVTGHTHHGTIEAAIAAGVDDVLAKPLAPEPLYRHVVSVLSRPRRYVRKDGYYGPEIEPALRRLRALGRPRPRMSMPRPPGPVPRAPAAPRRSLPGLDVEIRAPVAYHGDATFLD